MTECNSSQLAGCKSGTLQKLHSTMDDLLAILMNCVDQLPWLIIPNLYYQTQGALQLLSNKWRSSTYMCYVTFLNCYHIFFRKRYTTKRFLAD